MKAKMMYMFGLLAAFTLTACSDNESEPSIVTVESISISPLSISLERDKTYQLQAEVTPKEATEKKVSWSSSDTQVATVSENGLVTGVNRGTGYRHSHGRRQECHVPSDGNMGGTVRNGIARYLDNDQSRRNGPTHGYGCSRRCR